MCRPYYCENNGRPAIETVGLDAGYNTSAICKMLLEDFKIQATMGKGRGCQQKGKFERSFAESKVWESRKAFYFLQ